MVIRLKPESGWNLEDIRFFFLIKNPETQIPPKCQFYFISYKDI